MNASHSQDHAHDHSSGHTHTHVVTVARRAAPGLSLLRISLAQRLAIALGLTTLIWLAVLWALMPS